MSWREELLPASFRGVPFDVRSASGPMGRRTATHEFPRSDVIEHEDLGAADKPTTIRGYILGDDYLQKKRRFEDALNLGTEGALVHPWRGTGTFLVGDVSSSETSEEGGMVRYVITFLPQVAGSSITKKPDTKRAVINAKASVAAGVEADFIDVYELAGKPAKAIADARQSMDDALSFIDSAKRVAGSAADFKREVQNMRGDLIALSLDAEYLVQSFTGLIDFGTTEGASVEQMREQRQIAMFSGAQIVGTPTDISDDPDYPSRQIQDLINYGSLTSQIGLIADIEFATVDDAETERATLFDSIDEVLASGTISDDLYAALRDAKAAVYNHLETQTTRLPLIVEYESPEVTNTLSLMYSLYESFDNEEDFINRNELIHPGFVPSGVPLQIKVTEP